MKLEKVNQRIADEEMLQEFLAEWPIDQLDEMSLQQYNDVGNKETFCQHVETKTRPLGSIKGSNSTKFGIYKRLNIEKRPAHTISNSVYTWAPRYNSTDKDEKKAFENVIREVQQIANLSAVGDFRQVEYLGLNSLFRWKVAYLYSNSRLIPIFSKTNLVQIVERMGMDANNKTPYYQMQEFLMAHKPFDETVVEYMRRLYTEHRIKIDKVPKPGRTLKFRRSVDRKDTGLQSRNGHGSYTASLFHNEIQTTLYKQLCEQYGVSNVNMELDWVDVLVEFPEKIVLYEIKSDRYATECIIKGFGQILGYAFRAKEKYQKKIELIIAGVNNMFENEQLIIGFIFGQIEMPISYLKIGD